MGSRDDHKPDKLKQLAWHKRKASKSVGHPNAVTQKKIKPVDGTENKNVFPNKNGSFVVFAGEFYLVRDDFKGDWFEKATKGKAD